MHRSYSNAIRRGVAPLGLASLVVFAVLLAVPVGTTSSEITTPSPSYAALRPLLQAGAAKDTDEGIFDLFQVHMPDPAAWIWAYEDVPSDVLREILVLHPGWIGPESGGNADVVAVEGYAPSGLDAFLDWIVARSPHVGSASELTVVETETPLQGE